jgi:predicted transcriptional regulator
VPAEQLPNLVGKVGGLVCELAKAQVPAAQASASPATTRGPRRKVVEPTPKILECLDCGMQLKMLKRHLLTVHSMTPEDYRKKHNLPGNAPMVTSGYAELRSQLAKKHGLGKKPEDRERIRSAKKER